jgi:hypothetical protein
VKSPWLCDYLGEILRDSDICIDHAIIPIRDLYAAAESRREIWRISGDAPGSLWHTTELAEQERVLEHEFYNLFDVISEHDIPVTLLRFPRLAQECAYLYRKLAPLFPEISWTAFEAAFQDVVRPELVRNLTPAAVGQPDSIAEKK